jgi:hypothetical protein
MRDPNRIKPILAEIEALWEKYPQLRLGQLLGNCFHTEDIYYVEDRHLIKRLKETYDQANRNQSS